MKESAPAAWCGPAVVCPPEGQRACLDGSFAFRRARKPPKPGKDALLIVNLSGRGDNGVAQVEGNVGLKMPE